MARTRERISVLRTAEPRQVSMPRNSSVRSAISVEQAQKMPKLPQERHRLSFDILMPLLTELERHMIGLLQIYRSLTELPASGRIGLPKTELRSVLTLPPECASPRAQQCSQQTDRRTIPARLHRRAMPRPR